MYLLAILYAIVALAVPVKAIPAHKNIASKLFPSSTISSSSQGSLSWQDDVVQQHNVYREKYGASPLAWSDELYPDALDWANQCNFQHSNAQGSYGENLAAGSGSAYGFLQGLTDWMDEANEYNYGDPTFSSDTGHFTEVIWKSTKEVACAMSNCPAGTIFSQDAKFIVCRYSPPGNILGEFAQNVGKLLTLL